MPKEVTVGPIRTELSIKLKGKCWGYQKSYRLTHYNIDPEHQWFYAQAISDKNMGKYKIWQTETVDNFQLTPENSWFKYDTKLKKLVQLSDAGGFRLNHWFELINKQFIPSGVKFDITDLRNSLNSIEQLFIKNAEINRDENHNLSSQVSFIIDYWQQAVWNYIKQYFDSEQLFEQENQLVRNNSKALRMLKVGGILTLPETCAILPNDITDSSVIAKRIVYEFSRGYAVNVERYKTKNSEQLNRMVLTELEKAVKLLVPQNNQCQSRMYRSLPETKIVAESTHVRRQSI